MRRAVRFLLHALTFVPFTGCAGDSDALLDPDFQPSANLALPVRDETVASTFPPESFSVHTEVFSGRGSLPSWNVDGYVEFTPAGTCAMDLTMAQAVGLFRDSHDP